MSVVAYHFAPYFLKGGFVGVDVFFVISGFLISTIIFGNLENKSFSYRTFYARRIRRIFPALNLVLLAVLPIGWYVLFTDEWQELGKHIAAGAGFVSNLVFLSEVGYFDRPAELKPLLHLWSLGVEEQFYIFWPIILVTIHKFRLNFLFVTVCIGVVSFAINIHLSYQNPGSAFFSPLSRIWELMIGGMLAYIYLTKPSLFGKPGSSWRSIIGLGMILAAFISTDRNAVFPGWWAMIPVVGTALIISNSQQSWMNRFVLGNRLLVGIGLISYPLYLWHWPILSFIRIIEKELPDFGIRFIGVCISILLAWLTYEFVERRVRLQNLFRVAVVSSCSMAALLVLGLCIWSNLLHPRLGTEGIDRVMQAAGDWAYPDGLDPFDAGDAVFYKTQENNGKDDVVVFWGDSHVAQYGPRIVELAKKHAIPTTVFAVESACYPAMNMIDARSVECSDMRLAASEYIQKASVKTVVIGSAWNIRLTKRSPPHKRQRIIDSILEVLKSIPSEKEVFLLLDNPIGREFSPKYYYGGSRLKSKPAGIPADLRIDLPDEQKEIRSILLDLAKQAGAKVIDPTEKLCEKNGCIVSQKDGIPVYMDSDHLRSSFVRGQATYIDTVFDSRQ